MAGGINMAAQTLTASSSKVISVNAGKLYDSSLGAPGPWKMEAGDPGSTNSYADEADEIVNYQCMTNYAHPNIAEGYLTVVSSTQLAFVASGVTNVIDKDITTAGLQ